MISLDIQNLYTTLNTLSRQNQWPALESCFYGLTEQHAGAELAALIQSIDTQAYISRLNRFLIRECLRLSHHAVRALYFEYDPGHQWDSVFYICDRYSRASQANEEWSRHWIDHPTGPDFVEFASIFQRYGGLQEGNDRLIAVSFYLMARTAAAYAQAIDNVETHYRALCIGHKGQRLITRLYE